MTVVLDTVDDGAEIMDLEDVEKYAQVKYVVANDDNEVVFMVVTMEDYLD